MEQQCACSRNSGITDRNSNRDNYRHYSDHLCGERGMPDDINDNSDTGSDANRGTELSMPGRHSDADAWCTEWYMEQQQHSNSYGDCRRWCGNGHIGNAGPGHDNDILHHTRRLYSNNDLYGITNTSKYNGCTYDVPGKHDNTEFGNTGRHVEQQ